nr:integrase, catalytic region, zinc finger, CCHC-type, peptidase aspartic, catalytic [Tanacetum cinerariifolium]
MMNKLIRNQCKVTNHQVNVQFLLQLQPEWQRGKAIVNSPQPIYGQEPFMVAEDDETSKDKEIDKLDNSPRINRNDGYENQRIDNVVGAKETVGSTVVQKSGIQCYNCKEFRHVARECQKLKRAKDATYHREKMLLEEIDQNDDDNDLAKEQLARRNSKEYASQMEFNVQKSERTVASESNQKPRKLTRKLYERVSKTCTWWYSKFTPSGYKWKPKSGKENVNPNLVEILQFIVDSGCSKHMTGNLKLLINFVEKFMGTVKFGNDQIAPIIGYGDLVQRAVTIKRVYYVEGLNHNLFSVGQFCDADLEVVFRKATYFIRDLKRNDLLTGTEFLNQTLHAYFAAEGILHQTSVARTSKQNGVVERRNRTLVEASRTMLSTAKRWRKS